MDTMTATPAPGPLPSTTAPAPTATVPMMPPGYVPPSGASIIKYLASIDQGAELEAAIQLSRMYDAAVEKLLVPGDYQTDRSDDRRTFKKKSAWRKLARYFGIDTDILNATWHIVEEWNEHYRGADGDGVEVVGRMEFIARVIVQGVAPWGQITQAVGVCSSYEKRFQKFGAYLKRHPDCVATAETRATNRCISNLIANGEVSAEEVDTSDFQSGGGRTARPRGPVPNCPTCQGAMWDNRGRKRSPKEPDFRCKNNQCVDEKGFVTAIFEWKPPAPTAPAAVQPGPVSVQSDGVSPKVDGDSGKPVGQGVEAAKILGPVPIMSTAGAVQQLERRDLPRETVPVRAAPTYTDPYRAEPAPAPAADPVPDELRKVNGIRLGDMPIVDLEKLLLRCASDPDRFKELSATVTRVLERKTQQAIDDDELPF